MEPDGEEWAAALTRLRHCPYPLAFVRLSHSPLSCLSVIARLDYAIEEEKQRKYTDLTVPMIERYLHNVICGDIDDVDVRKLIVKHFIREVQLFNDQVLISFNFTDGHPPYSINKTQSIVLEKWVKKGLNALPLYRSSNILTTCPPMG